MDETDEISIGDLAREIAKAYDYKGEIIFDTSAADGQMKKTASNAKLRKLLPGFQFLGIGEGIKQTVEWFKLNQNSARL